MIRWTVTAVWGERGEGPGELAHRTTAFLRRLGELGIGLDRWFIRGQHAGRDVLWDARGESRVVEAELEKNADQTDFGQGLPPMRSYLASIFDGGSPRDAEILLQCIVDAPPMKAWFPNRVELSFREVQGDEVLRTANAIRIAEAVAEAFAPRSAVFDLDEPRAADPDDEFYGRPPVGRVTYLSDGYGAAPPLASARTARALDGTIVAVKDEWLSASPSQAQATAQMKEELRACGLLLSRGDYEKRLAAKPGP